VDEVLIARIQLPADRYPDDNSRFRFYDQLLTDLRALPGLQHAETVSFPPGDGAVTLAYQLEGEPEAEPSARPAALRLAASPGYLSLIDIPILAGRAFDDRDGFPGNDSIVVTNDFASRVWPGQSPLGKRLRFYPEQPPGNPSTPAQNVASAQPGPWLTVVGVSGDLEQRPSQTDPLPLLFIPYAPGAYGAMTVLLRSPGDPAALAAPLRAAVQRIDPDRALGNVATLAERAYSQGWYLRVFGAVFSIFAAGALLMASIGIYAVVSQTTLRRTREVGIRMALGATSRDILMLVIGRGSKQLIAGLVLGLAAALGATRLMAGELLFNVSPSDPIVFGTVIAIVTFVGLAACWLPARRAARLHPVKALRHE
jgi:predicted permease